MNHSKFPSPLTQVMINGKNKKLKVTLPENECFRVKNIFTDHEYEIKPCYLPSTPVTVVDIGANVGLFALYMMMTHSISTMYCFEPAPASIELLKYNTRGFENIDIHPYGLTNRDGNELLRLHPQNSGENTIVKDGIEGAETIEVQIRDANSVFGHIGLTYIDVLKIDTEGCEIPILESLRERLEYVGIILLEYHSEKDRRHIDQLLPRFKMIGARTETMDVGTVKYINRRLVRKP